ncbi:D-lactate dehydrogenase [Aestuariibacter sp. GS-14]|uniref:D-lactate dehydrogenase n=1 Tax=Aestuariibacter sp. GS-14 TaxID=2590670 RepID=UPI001125F97A|nr:D-lactate dehydrogenase [Aestuariibacter sp. GS-14]TPV60822.1 D-lactate dehydrogenase [Aestuariibacter sp. GS-14]
MSAHPVIKSFASVLSVEHILTESKRTEHYRSGWRSGKGEALAVVFPQTLLQLWEILEICVEHNCIIIMQAAKTGLTEGSTPSGQDYDRDIVIINTLAMNELVLLGNGEQILSFPGTTLHQLESSLKPLGRAPHSVIGSSCLGASVVGGVANNSGGALVKRGPAYTELALFARVTKEGKLELVNHLDIPLGESPREILHNLQYGQFDKNITPTARKASASDYEARLRDVDANTPSRFNADTSRLFEASGCAGKLAVFAVRLDTFAIAKQEKTYYIGTNNPDVLTALRRHILSTFKHLPEVGEYMHRDIFDIARDYGKDTFLSVKHLGTQRLPKLFALKGRIDALLNKQSWLPKYLSDRVMQGIARCFPAHLPERLNAYRDLYEHHLILKMTDNGIAEADAYLAEFFAQNHQRGDYFSCTAEEAASAYLNRFAAAGAAIRYQLLNQQHVGDIVALDIALKRNDIQWVESLPDSISQQIDKALYYGHFFCHVFHQDYVLKKGADAKAVKAAMLTLLDSREAKYPAEHNVGHLYKAEDGLAAFYRELDPTNTFNPGVGKLDKHKRQCGCC